MSETVRLEWKFPLHWYPEEMEKLMSSLLHQAKTVDGSPLKLRFNEKELSFVANCRTHPPDKEGLVSKKGPGKGQGTVETARSVT